MSIGRKIKTIREKLGVGQNELAKKLGMFPQTLNRIETGKQQPRPAMIAKIAEALGVTVDQLESISPSTSGSLSLAQLSLLEAIESLKEPLVYDILTIQIKTRPEQYLQQVELWRKLVPSPVPGERAGNSSDSKQSQTNGASQGLSRYKGNKRGL